MPSFCLFLFVVDSVAVLVFLRLFEHKNKPKSRFKSSRAEIGSYFVYYYFEWVRTYIETRKEEYYFTLNRCSNGVYVQNASKYHIEHFCAFMLKVLRASLIDIGHYRKKYQAKKILSESASRVLSCFNEHPEIKLTNRQLVEMTNLPRRTVANALKQLKEHNFIQSYGVGAGSRYQLTF